jgi:hypothetical protein
MEQKRFSLRRVATVVAVLGALLFTAGLALDVTRDSIYRHFYLTNDAATVVLFCVAFAYLQWGPRLSANGGGRVAGRVAQGFAVLACAGQTMVWVHVAQRGDVWWALVFVVPTLTAAILAIAAVHWALSAPRVAGGAVR